MGDMMTDWLTVCTMIIRVSYKSSPKVYKRKGRCF